ncbi:hypothetical protein IWW47_004651 [Coemansia sp. RSA 2052]|nr:hypothetical protein IWW47_004651 [Coemansia sp. RSA 2052]
MLRHPPASMTITHKDVDELATMQRQLLDRIQHGAEPETPGAGDTHGRAGGHTAASGRGGARQVTFDGHGAARQQRQQLSVSERLGL